MEFELSGIPFTAKSRPVILKESSFSVTKAIYFLHGFIRLSGTRLLLEWSGTKKVVTSSFFDQVRVEPVPVTFLELPVARITRLEIGGWWKPKLEIEVGDLNSLSSFPGSQHGKILLTLSRQDRKRVLELVVHTKLAMAETLLLTAQSSFT